jgi:hypothetical protein
MACTFCATGWAGYRGSSPPGRSSPSTAAPAAGRDENGYGEITNIVFMGMGEPLMNPRAVFPTLAILNRGYGVGARRITVSTVGVVPGILEMAEMPEQYRLARLAARAQPRAAAAADPGGEEVPAPGAAGGAARFDAAGGKRITFEYVMIDGVNDAPELADELAELVGEFNAFVNLIPFNPIPGTDWKPTPPTAAERLRGAAGARGDLGVRARAARARHRRGVRPAPRGGDRGPQAGADGVLGSTNAGPGRIPPGGATLSCGIVRGSCESRPPVPPRVAGRMNSRLQLHKVRLRGLRGSVRARRPCFPQFLRVLCALCVRPQFLHVTRLPSRGEAGARNPPPEPPLGKGGGRRDRRRRVTKPLRVLRVLRVRPAVPLRLSVTSAFSA